MNMDCFVDPRYEKIPLNLKKFFPDRNQFFVEIGFGNGDFLTEKALSNQRFAFIGIEVSLTSITKLLTQIKKFNINNIAVVMCDAKFATRELFDENLDGIFMNFPCPWPKKRHQNRRLNDIGFVKAFTSALKKNSFVSVYSDHYIFINELKNRIKYIDCFSSIDLKSNPPMINTKYEKKWKKQKKNIFHLSAIKRTNITIPKIAGGGEMPHVHMENFSCENLKNVLGRSFKENDIFFKYNELFSSINEDLYLLQTIAVDDDFEQCYFIEIRKKTGNNWLISLNSNGLPFRTPSVKKSVFYLGELQK
ncbi:MAG: tRNA (guanosine(46)-N7)-methyltransferase TrmB [Petrotogales bacterium]